jgi:hypothetical protein
VKVRYGDFTTLTRQITVETPLTEASDIYRLGCFLLGREKLVSRPLRLLGLAKRLRASPPGENGHWSLKGARTQLWHGADRNVGAPFAKDWGFR